MTNYISTQYSKVRFVIVLLVTMGASGITNAHEYSNLNEIMIDRTNESINDNVIQVQSFMTDIFQKRYVPKAWPDVKMKVLGSDLMHQLEEADMSLEYFASNGINLQSSEVHFDQPLVGRSIAASKAIRTTYNLIKHVNSLETVDDFITEIYTGGMSAQMYNLITAYREKMDLYRAIFINVAGPSQQSGGTTVSRANTEPAQQEISILPYAIAIILGVLGMVVYLVRNKSNSATGH